MASTVLTRHACDKCGRTVERSGGEPANPIRPPKEWADVQMFTRLPGPSLVGHPEVLRMLLCPVCAAALCEHLGRPRKSPAEVAAEQPLGEQ